MIRSGPVWAFLTLFSAVSGHAGEFCGLKCDPTKFLTEKLQTPIGLGIAGLTAACGGHGNQSLMVETPLIAGGRKMMALTYGSCDVLKLKTRESLNPNRISATFKSLPNGTKNSFDGVAIPGGVNQVRESHPYLGHLRNAQCSNAEACSGAGAKKSIPGVNDACKKIDCDVYQFPPLYQFGGKASDGEAVHHEVISHKSYDGKTKKTTTTRYSVSGVDCSFFVFQSMGRAGLNYYPGKPSAYQSTNGLATLGEKTKSGERRDCFDRVETSGGIQSGDLLVVSGVHVVMIDTVGPDPFGIHEMIEGESAWNFIPSIPQATFEDIRSKKSKLNQAAQFSYLDRLANLLCSDLDPAQFKITIIHSSPNGNGVGIQREKVCSATSGGVGLGRASSLLSLLQLKAKAECIGTLKQKWNAFAPGYQEAPNLVVDSIKKSESVSGGSKVLRHASNEPGCRGYLPFDPTLNCADCCDLNSSFESIAGGQNAKN
jgi:hypothetical protein